MTMSTAETIALFEKYVIPNYTRNPLVLVRGEGAYVWDADGNRYLDLFPGWAVNGLGHCHPRVTAAIRDQAGTLLHVPNNYYIELQGILAKCISEASFGGQCFLGTVTYDEGIWPITGDECITMDIPAVSEWGLVAMTLLLLTAGTLLRIRQGQTQVQRAAQTASPPV